MSVRSGRTGGCNSSIHSTTADGSSRAGSIFSTATRNGSVSIASPPSAYGLRTLHAAGADGLPGAHSTPAQLRTELADVEAEGQRLLAVFDGLRAKARADYGEHHAGGSTTNAILESPLSDAAGEWEMVHHSPSLGSVASHGGPAGASNGGLKPALKKTSYSTPPSAVNGQQHLRSRDSLSPLASLPASLQRRPSDGRTILPERPMLPVRQRSGPCQSLSFLTLMPGFPSVIAAAVFSRHGGRPGAGRPAGPTGRRRASAA